jgi:antitoxin MazE
MKTRIIKIGNSKGIRIPKALLDQSRLGEEVELRIEGEEIVIRPLNRTRGGWEEAFQRMAQEGDDLLLDSQTLPQTEWDQIGWQW